MALNFRIAEQIYEALPKLDNYRGWNSNTDAEDSVVVVKLDEQRRAQFVHIGDGKPLAGNELKLPYRVRNDAVKFATDAYLFQEGHAQIYEAARYGQFRINERGDLLLASMYDKNIRSVLRKWQPKINDSLKSPIPQYFFARIIFCFFIA